MLWTKDFLTLPDSKPTALIRLLSIKKKMTADPNFAAQYTEKIEDYITKGYARKITLEEQKISQKNVWYLPHFAVKNENKPGKLRLIFDAAAKTRGTSLNDVLLKGPDLLQPLMSVLFKFRQKEIAICGDIREMFHQILIRTVDQPAQRFLWKEHPTDREPNVFQMTAMTFRAASSPCSAYYVKNLNATRFGQSLPNAMKSTTGTTWMII